MQFTEFLDQTQRNGSQFTPAPNPQPGGFKFAPSAGRSSGSPYNTFFSNALNSFAPNNQGGGFKFMPTGMAPSGLVSAWANSLSTPITSSPTSGPPTAGGTMATLGGEWAGIDKWNAEVAAASQATGVPANLLKAIGNFESGGDQSNCSPQGACGIMQIMPDWEGHDGLSRNDPAQNIMLGAKILQEAHDNWVRQGAADPWQEAVKDYIGRGGADAFGTDSDMYWKRVSTDWQTLNAGTTTQITLPGQQTGSADANSVLAYAKTFVGVPYVWGGIPERGQDPWQTGWDCSGFTYFMDQTKGNGQLPMGSHYQYQYAADNGKLITDTSQFLPGDIVFIDTGWMGGAGSELNRAGHVGIYLGNGQIINALNPDAGTVISDMNSLGKVMGAMHETWSGGVQGAPAQGGSTPAAGATTNWWGGTGGQPMASTGLSNHWW